MSRSNFVQFKEIEPISMYRGTIENMTLSFSLKSKQMPQCVANIEKCNNSILHGCIARLTENDMYKMIKFESWYDRRSVNAKYYQQDIKKYDLPNKNIEVEVFIHDDLTQETMEETLVFIKDGTGVPSKNYLQTLINGAKELKLDEPYINKLQNHGYIKQLKFNPTDVQWKVIHGKTFKMKQDVENVNNNLFVLKGIVFDSSNSFKVFKRLCDGKDLTFNFMTKRWAFYGDNHENLKCIDDINKYETLQEWIHDQLQRLLNGLYSNCVVGKLDSKELNKFESYKW